MSAIADAASARNRSIEAETLWPEDARIWRGRIDARLESLVADGERACPRLLDAMRYALLSPGKRVRPLLAVLTALDYGRDAARVLDFGCALEMVHCASLILDDLPCMDDAQLRRGRPAAHRRFGEATTTLAAVGLLNEAYGVLAADGSLSHRLRSTLAGDLSAAVGTTGLVSGQSRDLSDRSGALDEHEVAIINRQKTGVLFELAIAGAGRIIDLPAECTGQLNAYATHIGLAFQCADDLLDAVDPAADSGKDRGIDRGKAGSVHEVGADELRRRLRREIAEAESKLDAESLEGDRLGCYVRALFARLI
jgi:geranylgeranyl diphosphate synthase type II